MTTTLDAAHTPPPPPPPPPLSHLRPPATSSRTLGRSSSSDDVRTKTGRENLPSATALFTAIHEEEPRNTLPNLPPLPEHPNARIVLRRVQYFKTAVAAVSVL
jgi:hypothetical protein